MRRCVAKSNSERGAGNLAYGIDRVRLALRPGRLVGITPRGSFFDDGAGLRVVVQHVIGAVVVAEMVFDGVVVVGDGDIIKPRTAKCQKGNKAAWGGRQGSKLIVAKTRKPICSPAILQSPEFETIRLHTPG